MTMLGESYIKETDLHQSVLDLINDEEQMNKFIKSTEHQNENDFKSGMIFGMSMLAAYTSVNAKKIFVCQDTGGMYLDTIRDLYKNERFSISATPDEFDVEKHDAVINYGCLCIRGKSLDRKLGSIMSWYTRNNCIKELISKEALKRTQDKYTVKPCKNFNGRFYAIKLEALE